MCRAVRGPWVVVVAVLLCSGFSIAFGSNQPGAAAGGLETCVGDCDDDGEVAIDELIFGVNVALGGLDVEDCVAFDHDGNLAVTIDELLTAVDNTLNGCGRPTVLSAGGAIEEAIAAFRDRLGPDNGGGLGPLPSGRREINWDAVPDEDAAPNFLPGDFFNAAEAPRARGAILSTPGTGVQVSADSDNPTQTAVRFGHLNATYADQFVVYSAERLFSPIGSNIVDLTFRIPGSDTPAVVRGFGAVYTDVDQGGSSFEYFDAGDQSLGRFSVPSANHALSFLGVLFSDPVVARVRIQYGNQVLGPNEAGTVDVSVMDDFIFGEPQPFPAE